MSSEENSSLSHDWLVNTVQEKYRERQLGELVSISIEPMGSRGDNFTSHMERVKMIFSNEAGNKRYTIMLVAKLNKSTEYDGREGEYFWSNRTEVQTYTNVLGRMEDLMMEFNDQRETLWPTLYGHIPYTVLLLEDLGQRYKMIPRSSWLDDEHAFLVLRSLGRFHAMSKILIKRGDIGEQCKNKYSLGSDNPFHGKWYSGSMHLLSESMINKLGCWKSVESSESWGKRLQVLARTIFERRVEICMNYDKRFEVINHGDFRSGNMMLKSMEYTGRPIGVKFYDFQIPHLNSFAWDLAYFFSVSIDPSLRRTRRNELLEAYQQSLADNLKFFNYGDYIPTIEDVVKETDRLALVEFSEMVTITPIATSFLANAMWLDKITTHPPEESMDQTIFSHEHFVNGIKDDFERAIQLNLI